MKWTEEELKLLKECYDKKMLAKDIGKLMGRTIPSIRIKASKLGYSEPHPEIRAKAKPHRDLTGMKFGKLTAIRPVYQNIDNAVMWECRCDCGNPNNPIVNEYNLMSGHSKSCSCSWAETCKNNFKKYNAYDLSGYIGICCTEQGDFLFDKEDYELIKDYYWRIGTTGYAQTTNPKNGKAMMFHRLVMGAYDNDKYKKLDIDHKDLNPLNNQKSNLRFATRSQNNMNKPLQKNNTSGCTGVQKVPRKNGYKWIAEISQNGKRVSLGTFDTYEEAVNVRRMAEDKYYKDFAYRNTQY